MGPPACMRGELEVPPGSIPQDVAHETRIDTTDFPILVLMRPGAVGHTADGTGCADSGKAVDPGSPSGCRLWRERILPNARPVPHTVPHATLTAHSLGRPH